MMKLLSPAFSKALLSVGILSLFAACSDDNEAAPGSEFLTEGFVITGQSASGTANVFAAYFEELPSGDIDLVSSATSYSFFRVRGVKDGFMYGNSTGEDPGLTKFSIDAETQNIVEIDEFALDGNPGNIIFLDDERAIVPTFAGRGRIIIFNPETMSRTGEIDLSQATDLPDDDTNSITGLIYNKTVNKIYGIFYTDIDATAQFYDADAIYVEVIDATTLQWEKTIVHQNAEYAIFRGETNAVVDESGNTYIVAQGQYGLDNNFGPASPVGSRPQILKINANSEFDESYAFNPINTLGFENNFFQLFTSMVYAGNNKAYGIGTSQTDDPAILALLQKFATVGLTDEEFGTLTDLVFNGEGMSVLEVDLVSKSVREVSGIPKTAGFAYPFLYNYNGRIFAQVTSPSNNENAFYEINTATNTGTQVYNITTGGFAFQLIDLNGSLQ